MNESTINPEAAPYQLQCKDWPGLAKVVEENGELGQILGKIVSCGGQTACPWTGLDFKAKLVEETADLLAALTFLVNVSPHINEDEVLERAKRKLALFDEWRSGNTAKRFDEIVLYENL